jgi:hypothetical protein
MDVIDGILSSYVVGSNETAVYDSLVGVGFIVVNESGKLWVATGISSRADMLLRDHILRDCWTRGF